jgi:hypothetical protein
MFNTLSEALSPYMLLIRLTLVALLLGLCAYAGYDYGTAKANKALAAAQLELETERKQWAQALAKADSDAEAKVADMQKQVTAAENKAKEEKQKAEAQYANDLKRIEDEKAKFDNAAVDSKIQDWPDDGTNPSNYQLWVFVETATCTGNSDQGSNNAVPSTGTSVGEPATQQCRLSAKTAVPLVQIVSDADKAAAALNLCIRDYAAQPKVGDENAK